MSETPVIPEKTLNKLIQEIGADDTEAMATIIDTQRQGTVLESVIQSGKSLVMKIYQVCLDSLWHLVQGILRALIPQLFLRYSTGTYLEEYAKDHGMDRHPGQYTRLTLDCTKDAGISLSLATGDVIYIVEQNPRRYEVLADQDVDLAVTDFQVQVQALAPYDPETGYIFSKDFNAATGLSWDCEEALPFNTIEFTSGVYDQVGEDPEEDEVLRARIYALRSLEAIEVGIDLYYQNLLKTVALVVHVTLDDVDSTNGTLYYTLYGSSGELSPPTQTEAQTVFDAQKMRTDKGVIQLATAHNLALTISRTGGGSDSEIIDAVGDHFLAMDKGQDFESCFLYDTLADLWPEMIFRISPTNYSLPTGTYFIPNTTVELIP